jgi:hypothetical protein
MPSIPVTLPRIRRQGTQSKMKQRLQLCVAEPNSANKKHSKKGLHRKSIDNNEATDLKFHFRILPAQFETPILKFKSNFKAHIGFLS